MIADSITGGGTDSSGNLWTYDPAGDRWDQPATRPDTDQNTPLLYGASVQDEIYFVGSLTQISAQQARRPDRVGGRGVLQQLAPR